MTREAAEAMNAIRISEAQALNTEGYVVICGNGQVTAIVEEREAPLAELLRVKNGY